MEEIIVIKKDGSKQKFNRVKIEEAIDAAMQLGLYYGVNVVSTTCENCGHSGDFRESCPKCENTNLTEVTRCCGYLSFGQVKGESRYNPGKQKEIKDRVKHFVR